MSRFDATLRIALAAPVALPTAARAADAIELQGKGVQIYTCAADGWRLKAPEAVLTTAQGQEAGRHFAGPSWQAKDGSTVVGEPIASGASDAGSIPWLILRAKSHEGEGSFAAVRYIVRTRTSGGVAPASGCDSAHAGSETRVDYGATYTFFPG